MFYIFRKLRYYYISPLDRSLDELRKNLPKSKSQLAEIRKHARISKLRDIQSDYPSKETSEST